MKKVLTFIFIIFLFLIFTVFILIQGKSFEVIGINSPTEIVVDFNKNSIPDSDETVCVDNIEAFTLNMNTDFYNKYSKSLNLTRTDMLNLGYMADEYSHKLLDSKKVKVKFKSKLNTKCRFADIFVNDTNYSETLLNSGFAFSNNKIGNNDKFKQHLNDSKKLNLVILNHHSNKYHTLDCEFGNQAHDIVIIPQKQLPPDVIPCKYCHKSHELNKKKFNINKNNVYNIPNIKTPPLKITSGDITIYHTDYTKHLKPDSKCDTDVCKAFVKLVNNAKISIDIAIYGYENNPPITEALKQAKSRGVKIRFVYDEAINPNQTFYKGNNYISDIADISTSDRHSDGAKLMHNKFIIFDNKTVFTGSMNFSAAGLSAYDVNDIVIINSDDIANLYTFEFEQMINGKFHNSKLRHRMSNRFRLSESLVEVYFSPQDKSVSRIVQLIDSAKKYIYVPSYLITHKDISKSLIDAHKRGIDVKIIIDANSVNTKNSKHKILRDAGIALKVENYAGKLHAKGMIIDGSYIIVGSMNFSNSGENKNDENMLVIQNYQLATNYKNFFNYLWNVIPDKYLKYNPLPEGKDSIGSCSDGVDNNFNGKIDKEEDTCK